MHRIRYIYWNAEEAAARTEEIRRAGFEVEGGPPDFPAFLRKLREDPPAAVLISLDRVPSQGRDVAVTIRHQAATRRIPLVFAGGLPEKVERVREVLPDALFTDWPGVAAVLSRAISSPPVDPVKPESVFAAYAGTPLPRKLGIKPGLTVRVVGAPEGFAETLGALPDGAELRAGVGSGGLTLWFIHSREELGEAMPGIVAQSGSGPVWIAWPKKVGKAPPVLTQQDVRAAGLAAGLVDYKICAVDERWSALLFRCRA